MKCKAVQMALNTGQSGAKRGFTSRRIRQHLRTCAACRTAQTELQWLADRAAAWRSDAPNPALEGRIQQAIGNLPAPALPVGPPAAGIIHWIAALKENPKMKRRIGFTGIALLLVAGGLMTTLQPHAAALTQFAGMQKAMQSVRTVHLSLWENTSMPDRQFCQRETWVQGDKLRQYIPGKLWLISTPDTNWYYIAGKDRLEKQAHQQPPLTFDFARTLDDLKEVRAKGWSVRVESESDAVLRGREVARIQVTETAPTPEQMARRQAQAAEARREEEETARLKGYPSAPAEAKPTPLPILHSRRSLYWVDKATNLPLHSENYEEDNGRWVLTQRADYTYDEQFPANIFDPQDLLRVGRQECGKPNPAR